MRIVQSISLLVFAACGVVLTICEPSFLGANTFLMNFVNHEYINVLAVIVTVSLVSVTQIHLEYSRIERRFFTRVFAEARRQINLSALLMTLMLGFSFIISFLRAHNTGAMVWSSALHTAALLTIITSIFLMYDLVRTVYVLASEEPIGEDEEENDKQDDK